MHWNCPKCQSKVDFEKQMNYVFEEDGEAEFDPKHGLWLHTIDCDNQECNATWIVTVSKMYEEEE